eukprot:7352259-Pyramimonas_sp.AAC.1
MEISKPRREIGASAAISLREAQRHAKESHVIGAAVSGIAAPGITDGSRRLGAQDEVAFWTTAPATQPPAGSTGETVASNMSQSVPLLDQKEHA